MTDDYYRHSEGAALLLPDGTILLAWSRFYAEPGNPLRNDNGPANIVLARSRDNGLTWSEPLPLDLPRGGINNMQASFLQVDEVTQLYYSKRESDHASDKWLVESQDGGHHWTPPRRITPGDRRYTGPNDRMIRLKCGRILLPCHTSVQINSQPEFAPILGWSDDGGKTWQMGKPVVAEPSYLDRPTPLLMHEPVLVERRDGTVWMVARSTAGYFFESVSRDRGETWTSVRPTAIETLTAPPQVKRLSDGRLLMVWNPYNQAALDHLAKVRSDANPMPEVSVGIKRTLLAAATSDDDGKSWTPPLILADGGSDWGFAYPAILELPAQGEVLIFVSKTSAIIHPASLVQIRVPLASLPNS